MNSCHLISEGQLSKDRSTVNWRVDLDTEETFFIAQLVESVEALSLFSMLTSGSHIQYNILFLPSGVLLKSESTDVLVVDLEWEMMRDFIETSQTLHHLSQKLDCLETDLEEAQSKPFLVRSSWLSCPEVYYSDISKTKSRLKRKRKSLSTCIFRVILAWSEISSLESHSIHSRILSLVLDAEYGDSSPDLKLLLFLAS